MSRAVAVGVGSAVARLGGRPGPGRGCCRFLASRGSRRVTASSASGFRCQWGSTSARLRDGSPDTADWTGANGKGRAPARELSTSTVCLQYDLRKVDLLPSEIQKFYFDTHAVVRLLEENGLSTDQSEVVVAALLKIMNSNMQMIYKDMVTKVQQEIMLQQIMSQIAGVKKDMIILEKSEFSALRAENEKLKIELFQLQKQLIEIMLQQIMSQIAGVKKDMIILEKSEFSALRAENEKLKIELFQLQKQLIDEVNKLSTSNKLDLNLDKSRVKEMFNEHEKRLLETRSQIVELNSQQERAVTQTDRKIETEVAGLKTLLESHKLDTIKYLAGSVFTCLTIALGFYRVWM
ncbi:mitochondrial calcium uniporter regulator 1 [Callorhinchus milii]|uniref:mitochondrial calcium uniporter regulator 1 n=1 Tax=Callorhinchus milii TaxID=7868 RepID=UPI001C3FA719|nr:mitochondrial calcium uniporter regulator 1 [Callorhinchus milii]